MVIRNNSPIGFRVGSTSAPFFNGFVTGRSIGLPPDVDGYTAVSLTCAIWNGTSIVVNFDVSGSNSNNVTCNTATSTTVLTSNFVVTALQETSIDFGTVTGAPDFIYIILNRTITRE